MKYAQAAQNSLDSSVGSQDPSHIQRSRANIRLEDSQFTGSSGLQYQMPSKLDIEENDNKNLRSIDQVFSDEMSQETLIK